MIDIILRESFFRYLKAVTPKILACLQGMKSKGLLLLDRLYFPAKETKVDFYHDLNSECKGKQHKFTKQFVTLHILSIYDPFLSSQHQH